MGTSNPTRKTVSEVVGEWPDRSRSTARQLLEKYGAPDEATTERLIWRDNEPWARTTLHREGPGHRFPVPHRDILEQYVDYRVPVSRFDDLARFDGSVHANRTRGELGAACNKESANVLAVNMAHEVITGEKTPGEAREAYARIMARGKTGRRSSYLREFQFDRPTADPCDPDVTIVTEELKKTARTLIGRTRWD